MKKINWKNGFGEYLGFAIVAPILFGLIFFMITVYQVTVAEEKLIYAAYMCGRQAVISRNVAEATDAGKSMLDIIYSDSSTDAIGGIIVPGVGTATFKIENSSSVNWVKGNVIVVSVTQDLNPILPFAGGQRTRQLAMMIEQSNWGGT